jgi:hypothetical protein
MRRGKMKAACLIVFAVIALYFLSLGPVARFSPRNNPTVRVVYAPMEWIIDETPFGGPVIWYLKLWGVDP